MITNIKYKIKEKVSSDFYAADFLNVLWTDYSPDRRSILIKKVSISCNERKI